MEDEVVLASAARNELRHSISCIVQHLKEKRTSAKMLRGSVRARFSHHFHHLPGGEKHLELRRGRSLGQKANLKKPLVDVKPLPPPVSLGDKTVLEPRLDLPLAERRIVRGNEREGRHEENEKRPGRRGSFMEPAALRPATRKIRVRERPPPSTANTKNRNGRSPPPNPCPERGAAKSRLTTRPSTVKERMILADSTRETQRAAGKGNGRRRRGGRPRLANGSEMVAAVLLSRAFVLALRRSLDTAGQAPPRKRRLSRRQRTPRAARNGRGSGGAGGA